MPLTEFMSSLPAHWYALCASWPTMPLLRLGAHSRSPSASGGPCAGWRLYRTLTPDRFVYIRAAMFMLASSWNSSLAA